MSFENKSESDIQQSPYFETVSPSTVDGVSLDGQVVLAREKTNRIDEWIETSSEWFSALLVKETRQALKSRQFLWTFFGMLILIATWSVCLISFYDYNSDAQYMGPVLLMGFWVLLGFPLAIVIPFSAFRSLAHEFEDGTIQLVSITTMRPFQIILGKLGSAFLQILIYLAALAPCIAFTYLLRGIDIKQIALCTAVAVTGSACLCCFGLFMASSARGRTMGTASSVVLLLLLLMMMGFWIGFAGTMTFELNSMVFMFSEQGWVGLGGIFGFAITTALVLLAATSSQISFFSDNRVTLVRITLLIQQTVFLGIGIAALSFNASVYGFLSLITFTSMYWFFVGSMVASTSPEISNRVKRSLPTTFLGRSFTSLFYPGPGRGYLFVVANIWAMGIAWILLAVTGQWFMPGTIDNAFFGVSGFANLSPIEVSEIFWIAITNCTYATLYLSIVYLIIRWVQSYKPNVSPGYGLGIAIMLFFGTMIFSQVSYYNLTSGFSDYSFLLIGDWISTVDNIVSGYSEEFVFVFLVLVVTTLLIGGLAAIRAASELRYATQAIPQRVIDEKTTVKQQELPVGESIDEIFGEVRSSVESEN